MGQIPLHWSLYSSWVKNGFYILKWLEKKTEEYSLTHEKYMKFKFWYPELFYQNTAMQIHLRIMAVFILQQQS